MDHLIIIKITDESHFRFITSHVDNFISVNEVILDSRLSHFFQLIAYIILYRNENYKDSNIIMIF